VNKHAAAVDKQSVPLYNNFNPMLFVCCTHLRVVMLQIAGIRISGWNVRQGSEAARKTHPTE
jgi:hypothetical protein